MVPSPVWSTQLAAQLHGLLVWAGALTGPCGDSQELVATAFSPGGTKHLVERRTQTMEEGQSAKGDVKKADSMDFDV